MPFTGTPSLARSPPAYLIQLSPRKRLISKENIRLFCSNSVICHTSLLATPETSLQGTDTLTCCLLIASDINTAVSGTLYPSPRFSHTPLLRFSNFKVQLRNSHSHSHSSTRHQHMGFTLGKYASNTSSVKEDKRHFWSTEAFCQEVF